MIRNYFKIAWRNLWKNKVFSIINVISLAVGLSASMVIGMMVYYDFTFDTFHTNSDRIYRVTSKFQDPEGTTFNRGIAMPLVEEVEKNYSGVETTAFIFTINPLMVKTSQEEQPFKEPSFVTFASSGYFEIFQYKWLAGNSHNQLINPNEVILTESRAAQYFPNKNPSQIIGKTLIYNDSLNATVTGIVEDFKQRTDLVFQEFISMETIKQTAGKEQYNSDNWNNTNSSAQLVVKLKSGMTAAALQGQLNQTALDHEDAESEKYGEEREFYAQPFADIHFDTKYGPFDYSSAGADKEVMLLLGLIALFLLLLGCVNFINLNTAQASQRAKEIGIRKTLGSSKKQLITQFLGETFILTIIAGLFSLGLSVWLIHLFDDFIADGVDISMLADPYLLGLLALLITGVTLLAGFYPSVVLSRFKPAKVLKGENSLKGGNNSLRKFLTVFQFTIAYIFIIATLLIGKQIQFLLHMDMGFKTDSIVYLETPYQDSRIENREVLAQKLQTIPQIEKISIGGRPPASFGYNQTVFEYEGKDGERLTNINLIFGDSKYLDLYDIPLLAGRLPLNDTIMEVVINQAALKKLGFDTPEEAVNQTVNPKDTPILITGVMQDFYTNSLKYDLGATAFMGDSYRSIFTSFNTLHMTIKAGSMDDMSSTLTLIEDKFNEVYPNSNHSIQFMDDMVERLYNKERSMSKLLNWAMGLSVLISCLGLLGLVIYNTERRVKEIGIRKVLGATVTQLNILLCKDFLWLIAISFMIATPIAYYFLNNWLQDFAVKTDFSWWIFAGSGLGMIVLAFLIMSFKTISAAMENPVKNLKTE